MIFAATLEGGPTSGRKLLLRALRKQDYFERRELAEFIPKLGSLCPRRETKRGCGDEAYSAKSCPCGAAGATPRELRPKIIAIAKSSPGYFDLGLWLAAATSLALIVRKIASAIDTANTTYHNIYKGMRERKLLRIETERKSLVLEGERLQFVEASSRQLAQILGFSSPTELDKLTGSRYVTLKILMSVYRRVRRLCEYENSGKAHLGETAIPVPTPPLRRRRRQPPSTGRIKS